MFYVFDELNKNSTLFVSQLNNWVASYSEKCVQGMLSFCINYIRFNILAVASFFLRKLFAPDKFRFSIVIDAVLLRAFLQNMPIGDSTFFP
jgi:hypothetical protein